MSFQRILCADLQYYLTHFLEYFHAILIPHVCRNYKTEEVIFYRNKGLFFRLYFVILCSLFNL